MKKTEPLVHDPLVLIQSFLDAWWATASSDSRAYLCVQLQRLCPEIREAFAKCPDLTDQARLRTAGIRTHAKIDALPPAEVAFVNESLASGHTYMQIMRDLATRGFKIGKSSVGRYGKAMGKRRKHRKVADFPPEVMDLIWRQLADGSPYEGVVHAVRLAGFRIGKSSIGRFAQALRLGRLTPEDLPDGYINLNAGVNVV